MGPYSPHSPCAHSPGAKSSLRKARLVARPDACHVVLDDGAPAVEAGLAQTLLDLLCAVGVGVQPAHDLALEGVEFASARHGRAGVLGFGQPRRLTGRLARAPAICERRSECVLVRAE